MHALPMLSLKPVHVIVALRNKNKYIRDYQHKLAERKRNILKKH